MASQGGLEKTIFLMQFEQRSKRYNLSMFDLFCGRILIIVVIWLLII